MANLAQENNLRTLDTMFLTIGELNHRNRHNFEAQIKFEKTYFFGQDGWMSIDDVSRYAGALSVPADQV